MRLTTLALASALGLAAASLSAQAAPLAPAPADHSSAIVKVSGGCGWGGHPVPGHWNRWGRWIPPHCVSNHRGWGPYAGSHDWRWHRYY
jgi:hypothetical protein